MFNFNIVRDFVERLTTLQITAVLHADENANADDSSGIVAEILFVSWGIENVATLTNNRPQIDECSLSRNYTNAVYPGCCATGIVKDSKTFKKVPKSRQ